MDLQKHPAPSCLTQTRLYEGGGIVAEGFRAEEIPAKLREHPDGVLWLDLFDPDEDDLRAVAAEFDLHPLAVEDAVQDHQRPKLDHYPGHLFMNVYAVEVETEGVPAVKKGEISSFITPRALITVRKSASDVERLKQRWDADVELSAAGVGVGFLVYGLLDVVVSSQVAAANRLDQAMDKTEDAILEEGGAPRQVRRYGFALRKTLAELRRPVAPMPDVIAQLLRTDNGLVDDHLAPYFRDVDDEAQRATDTIDSARERINGLIEADLTEQSNELNDITRKLAGWAGIIAVPTAITGYFGQNLPYPGYQKWSGFLVSTAVIVVAGALLYWYFKRRGWL